MYTHINGHLRAAKEFQNQKPPRSSPLEEPASRTITILEDFDEQVALQLRAVKKGQESMPRREKRYPLLAERRSDTDDTLLWTRVLIVSDVLDHTCARASQRIEMALQRRLAPSVAAL